MRYSWLLLGLLLTGCKREAYSTICDMGNSFQGWAGTDVRFSAMIVSGGIHTPPMAVDTRCWRGIAADTTKASLELQRAFDSPGMFNKFAVVSGRIHSAGGRVWLSITKAENLIVKPALSSDEERASFRRSVREKNAYYGHSAK